MDESAVRNISHGVNQAGVRDHNERLVLSMIQRHGGLPSADIARRAGLSAQTVSVIIRSLERDGLLLRGEPVRGKVGKPSIPMELNPDGILSLGLNIGRRSASVVLVDALGAIRRNLQTAYAVPTPEGVTEFARSSVETILADLKPDQKGAIAGIGIAAPYEIWHWNETAKGSEGDLEGWRQFDLRDAIAEATGLTVLVQNDATSACTAEHMFGRGKEFMDYAYFYVGSFIGGGVVLNGSVFAGRTGNAGAFGSLPVPDLSGKGSQLLHNASIYVLAEQLEQAGHDALGLWDPENDWSGYEALVSGWIEDTAKFLSIGIVSVCSVIDFECAMIECYGPAVIRKRLVAAIRTHLRDRDTRGISDPVVIEASVGRTARAIGAASLPLMSRYFVNQPGFV